MAISTIIVGVLVSITGIATDTWTRSRSEIRAARQAKVLLDTMAKDFEALVSRRGNDFEWLHSEIDSGAQLPAVARAQGRGSDVAQLTFFTAATDRYLGQVQGNPGDVSCVSYQLRFRDPVDSGGREETSTFVVYRKLVNPDEAFENLLGKSDLGGAFSSYDNQVTDDENFVCENVFQFTVTYLVEVSVGSGANASVQVARVPLDSSSRSGRFDLTGEGIDTNISTPGVTADQIKSGRLTGVELSISVISDAGLARMSASGSGLSEDDYARQVYHYSRVVDVPSM